MDLATCAQMCPTDEVDFRIKNKLLHVLECQTSDHSIVEVVSEPDLYRALCAAFSRGSATPTRKNMVKEYTRSAAGKSESSPDDLRTFATLLDSVHYLLSLYKATCEEAFPAVYGFVSDRLRAVRQDATVQRLEAPSYTRLLDEMIPFYVETLFHWLSRPPSTAFDAKLHRTQLEECLSRWIEGTEHLKELNSSQVNTLAIYLLLKADRIDTLQSLVLSRRHFDTARYDALFDTIFAVKSGNIVRATRNFASLRSHTERAALAVHLPTLRTQTIHSLSGSHRSAQSLIPLATFERWLGLFDANHTMDVCKLLQIPIQDERIAGNNIPSLDNPIQSHILYRTRLMSTAMNMFSL